MAEATDEPMSDADSDTDDSDVSFEEVEASEADMQAMMQLEAVLEANPNLYDKHIEVTMLCTPV